MLSIMRRCIGDSMGNVLIINNKKYGGGAQSVFRENISILKKSGIFDNVYEGSNDKSSDLILKYYKKNIFGYFISITNFIRTVKFVKEHGIKTIHIHQHSGLSFLFLAAIKFLKNQSKDIKIILTNHTYSLVCPNYSLYNNRLNELCEMCIGKKIKLFPVTKNCCKGGVLFSFFRAIETLIINNILKIRKLIDFYIVPSKFLSQKLIDDGIKKEKIKIVANSLFNNCNYIDNKKEDIICYYGRFSEEKNILFTLESMLEILKKYKDYKFILIGKGPILQKIYNFIENIDNIEVKKRIIVKEYMEAKDLSKFLSKVKITVMPSKVYETFGLTILESIYYNCIPITINKGALAELIKKSNCGKTFKYNNKKDFINVLEKVIDNYVTESEILKETKKKIEFKNNKIVEFYKKIEEMKK